MLLDTVRDHISDSVKKHENKRSETLRFLLAAIQTFAISKYGAGWNSKVTDQDVLDVIRKQVKSHKESIESFEKAGRSDLVTKEKDQLTVLQEYLPPEMSDEEILAVLTPIVRSGEKNFGLLMKEAMDKLKGKADGGKVAILLHRITDQNDPH